MVNVFLYWLGAASWHVPFKHLSSPLLARLLGDNTPADLFVWATVFFFFVTHCPVMQVSCSDLSHSFLVSTLSIRPAVKSR